ncbi:S24 family peptidase [Paenibacillus sp. GYB004]|uniref:S24 family peptidase n=1 Tax=Paenibacillus sp. GYB004 TaxID=2994393 RepID=UPI002F96CC30
MLQKIDMLMRREGISSKLELSKKADIPYTTIDGMYKKGTENTKRSTLFKLANFFGCSLDFLIDDGMEVDLPRVQADSFSYVPVIGKISCGNGSLAIDDIEAYEPTPKEWLSGGDHIYLRAKGDSMTGARIYEGDLLLIRKQPEVENGEIAAVLINDEAVLKRVYRNGNQLLLQSENPNYPPIFAPPTEVKIIGKLKMNVIKY